MREVMVQMPDVGWADVGGLDDAQAQAEGRRRTAAEEPRGVPPLGIRPAKGFLLYGPPGTGKTCWPRRWRARRGQFHLHQIVRPAVQMVWRERAADRRLFARARQVRPCVIFIDEIDSLVPARGSRGRWASRR
jgi:transitional endoplasmic reticulum ATPase